MRIGNLIGIIGGSGFYEFLDDFEEKAISTPFGEVKFDVGTRSGKDVCFIPRHGKDHSIQPSEINYRGNIYGAHKLGVKYVLATNAVGSTNPELPPGTFGIPDNILDFTYGRKSTFFDGSDFTITTQTGKTLSGVVHTDVSYPFDQSTRELILHSAKQLDIAVHVGGTLAVAPGPRYETAAEIKAWGMLGADFVGMTSSPEVFLAREIELPYATVALVTNFAAGMQETVSHDEVDRVFKQNMDKIKSLFTAIITADS